MLLGAGADASCITSGTKSTLFSPAALTHASVCRALLAAGADVNFCWRGVSLLHVVRSVDVLHELLGAGLDVRVIDQDCSLLFHLLGVFFC